VRIASSLIEAIRGKAISRFDSFENEAARCFLLVVNDAAARFPLNAFR